MTRVTVTIEVHDEYADPNDDTGLTGEAYLAFCEALAEFGSIYTGPDRDD